MSYSVNLGTLIVASFARFLLISQDLHTIAVWLSEGPFPDSYVHVILPLSTTEELFLIGRAIRDKAMNAKGIFLRATRQLLVAVTFMLEFVVSAGPDMQ